MKLLLGCLALLCFLCSFVAPAKGAPAFYLAADANGYQCVLADPGPNFPFVTIYGVIDETSATAVAFSLQVPPASGLTFLDDRSPYTVTGASPTGALIQFGTCLTGRNVVIEMHYVRTSAPTPCTRIVPGPHPQLGAYRTDCSLSWAPVEYAGLIYAGTEGCTGPIPASNPSPANGAIDVSLSPSLSWDDAIQVCTGLLSTVGDPAPTSAYIYFGTTPNPPDLGYFTKPHTVGPLLPNKKYYWRVENSATWPYATSAIWSFTTTNTVATQPTTWGAIKALYR